MERDQILDALGDLIEKRAAKIARSQATVLQVAHREYIDLSTERTMGSSGVNKPLRIPFAFESYFVRSASDTTAEAKLVFGQDGGAIRNAIPVNRNDAHGVGIAHECYIINEAQSGKWMEIFFFPEGEFKPGSTIQTLSGAVTVTAGATPTELTDVTITSTTGATLIAANADRTQATIYNQGPDVGFIGGSGLNGTTKKGRAVLPGETVTWDSPGVCNARVDSGSAIFSITEFTG